MKNKWNYIFTLFLFAMVTFSSAEATINESPFSSKTLAITKVCTTNPEKPFTGDSPFIRFHSGIDENGVIISTPPELVIQLNPVNDISEKFAGIRSYFSSLDSRLPVTREIFYSTPLRSPPVIN